MVSSDREVLASWNALGFKLETGLSNPGVGGSKYLEVPVDPSGGYVSDASKRSPTIEEVPDAEQRQASMTSVPEVSVKALLRPLGNP